MHRLIKLDQLSGKECSIYTIAITEKNKTLLDKFIDENINST